MAGIERNEEMHKTALRVPKDLHAKIIAAAKENNRTMNAEIVDRLEQSFDKKDAYTHEDVEDLLKFIEDVRGKGIFE